MSTIRVGAHQIAYRERGDAQRRPPLIFIHGAGSSSLNFSELLNRLGQNHRVIALDLPGHGNSSPLPDLPGSGDLLATYRDIVAEFGERIGAGRFVLIGHSMGGAIAQLFALEYPDRLDHLVLMATGARLRVSPQLFDVLENHFDNVPQLVAAVAYSPHTSAEQAKAWAASQIQASQEIVVADFRACDQLDLRQRVAEIGCPTTIFSGADDRLTAPKLQDRLAEQIPGARLHRLSRAGHQLMVERADEVARLLEEAL